jgi:hypothetical protein
VDAGGQWLPPGAPGSNWVANADSGIVVPSAAAATPTAEEPRGRHWTPPEEAAPAAEPEPPQPQPEPVPPRARHSVGGNGQPDTETPQPPARHRGAAEEEPVRRRARDGEQTGGQSVADLLARLQANGNAEGGGRRRRRED